MKIGILLLNIDPTYRGGVNSFIQGLLGGLKAVDRENDYCLLVYRSQAPHYANLVSERFSIRALADEPPLLRRLKNLVRAIAVVPPLGRWYGAIESWLYRGLIRELNADPLDLYYAPVAQYFPLGFKGPVLVSPHDIQQIHFPENFSFFDRWQRAAAFRASLGAAAGVQASTHFIKNDFRNSLGIPERKLRVIPEGVMADFLQFTPDPALERQFVSKFKLPEPYIFYPAQHWPHKNHRTLIQAVAEVRAQYGVPLALVFTGARDRRFGSLYQFIAKNHYDNFIRFLGNIKFSELLYAYQRALAVAIPVVYESSSLPAKEAMALGKPVVASRNGSNEEANLNHNMLLFDTYNASELGEHLYHLYQDPELRARLSAAGRLVARQFRWETIAGEYIQWFKQVYANTNQIH